VRIYNNISEIGQIKNPVVTVGTFDGVHIGHQKVINQLVSTAKAMDGESVIITFEPHPRQVLQPGFDLRIIITREEKIRILEKCGVDHFIIIEFSREFAQNSSEEFLRKYIVEPLKPVKIIIGYDHHFGKGRQGDFNFLQEMGEKYHFQIEQVAMLDVKQIAVSSTKIRDAIKRGDMKEVSEFLGYNYSISGTVVHGNQIGRTLGFPTANIKPDHPDKLVPANGVYAVLVEWNGKLYKGMSNIGVRPTLNLHTLTIEVNIFDFDEMIYNQTITIFFLEHTRDEKKFRDLDLLRRRLIIDKLKVQKIFGEDVQGDSENGVSLE
jgi:riboflavin kinase/FMN adenylyltransferase